MLLMVPYLLNSVRQYISHKFSSFTCLRARQLGLLEEMMEVCNRDDVMMMSRVMFIESKQEISEEHVSMVWDHLIKKYPILRMRIAENNGKFYWSEMEEISPDITFENHGNWTACFEENSNFTYNSEKGPLWRVIFISNVNSPYTDHSNFNFQYALLLGFHHALFDGRSNLLLLNDFQHILNCLVKGTLLSLPAIVPARNVDRPLDDYITLQMTFWERTLCTLYSMPVVSSVIRCVKMYELKKAFQQQNLYMKHIGNFMAKRQNTTSVKQIVLTKQESQELFALCKRQKITVQSLLQTASAIALCRLLRNPVFCRDVANIPNLLSVKVNCMLGMKSLVKSIPADSLGYFAAVLFCELNISEFSDFWDLAAQTQQQLHHDQKNLAFQYLKNDFLFLKAKVNANDVLLDNSSLGRYPGLLMAYSNLGNCAFLDMDESSQVRFNGQVAACSEHKVGAIFSHSVVTLLGCLHWNVGYYKNISSEEVVEFYVKETKRIIMEAIKTVLFSQNSKHQISSLFHDNKMVSMTS